MSLFVMATILATSACEATIDVHGEVPPPERLAMIKVGQFTKTDVQTLIGTPSNVSTFGDDNWYYISNKMSSWAFFEPEEIERQVIAIDFDPQGKVDNIRKLSLKDGKTVTMVSRVTPTAGRDFSVLEQLLGNVGRFSNKPGQSGDNGP